MQAEFGLQTVVSNNEYRKNTTMNKTAISTKQIQKYTQAHRLVPPVT